MPMPDGRFERLEGPPSLPEDVQAALAKISRFDHLEIGEPAWDAPASAGNDPRPASPPAFSRDPDKVPCVHCGRLNEKERETCWACFRFVQIQASPQPAADAGPEITLVLDGLAYKSGDPGVPEDVRVLMDRIRKEGYSQELLADWRNWRATRHSPLPESRPMGPQQPQEEVEAFQGLRTSVIRIDGKVYRSDDPGLPAELHPLFSYMERNGVTPALMEYLRQFGKKVKYRPNNTVCPSDGDIEFWKQARGTRLATAPPRTSNQQGQPEEKLFWARQRFQEARDRIMIPVIALIAYLLYLFWFGGR